MAETEYKKAKREYVKYIQDMHIQNHMFYSPTDDDLYWNEKNKVLIINMEPYGYENCGFVNVDKETLIEWLYDEGKTGTRTIRYSVLFASFLLQLLDNKKIPTVAEIKEGYYNEDLLEATLSRITIYNIRPSSNSIKQQDINEIINSANGNSADYLRKEISCLDAKYIIISGNAGLIAFKKVMGISNSILRACNKFCVNGYTTRRSKYGHNERSTR